MKTLILAAIVISLLAVATLGVVGFAKAESNSVEAAQASGPICSAGGGCSASCSHSSVSGSCGCGDSCGCSGAGGCGCKG